VIGRILIQSIDPFHGKRWVDEDVCHPLIPYDSVYDDSGCHILFYVGREAGHDANLTVWYEQAVGGDLERVAPIYDGAEWHADMNS